MEQGCTCCPCHSQCMATHWYWDGSRGMVCAASLCVSCTVLGSSQALQLLKGGTCTQTWHYSWPLSTQDRPHRKSLDRAA